MNFEQIPRLILRRHVTVLMSLVALFVIGAVALYKVEQEFMPKGLYAPYLGTWISYPNSTPEEVEQMIVKKVEESLNTLPQRDRIRVNVTPNGAWFFVAFDSKADIDRAYLDMIDRLERVKPELPSEITNFRVWRWREGGEDAVVFILQDKESKYAYSFADRFVKKRFERIDGVAKVELESAGEKSIYIYFNNDLVTSHRVSLYSVIQKLQGENFNMSSGYVEEGNHKIFVRSKAKINSVEKLQNLVINKNGLKLKDIATIEYTTGDRQWAWRINGMVGMDLEITKESAANTVKVSDEIQKVVAELNDHHQVKEMGMKLQTIFAKGVYVKQATNNLLESGLWGGLFAFFLIYFFLRRFRMTIIITMAIPFSILMTIVAMFFMDWSLNGMTLMGLMIAIGLVVDNGIVIIENIFHKRREGLNIVDSAIQGTSEVGLAITLSTLTTVAIFVPILFLPQAGMGGYFKALGVPVIIALLASLFVAIVYIPFASTRISSSRPVKESAWLKKISEKLASITMFFVRRRVDAFVGFLILMVFLIAAPGPKDAGMGGGGNVNDFRLMIDLPSSYSFEKADNFARELEQMVVENKEKWQVKVHQANARTGFVRVRVFLEDKEVPPWYYSVYKNIRKGLEFVGAPPLKLRMTKEECEKEFRELVEAKYKIPGMKMRTRWMEDANMREDASVTLVLEGDNTKRLLNIAKEMERRLKRIPTVIATDINLDKGQEEVQIHLDRELLRKYGLSAQEVRGIIDYNTRGFRLRRFQTEDGHETSLIAQARKEDRERLEQLKNLTIYTDNGTPIPLATVATFDVAQGLGNIRHENGKTILKVKAMIDKEENIPLTKENISSVMAGLNMPFGYKWGLDRISRQQVDEKNDMTFAVVLGLVLVFLLMGVLFESFILPLSVIVSVPLAFIGSKVLLMITGTSVDLMARIGYIILVGVVVNNGIVLIDTINRYRKKGLSRNDAIHKASIDRARPIMLTALTTMCGLLPMVLGETEFIGIKYAPMGRVVFGGLLVSTFLTLIYTPVFYTFFDDVRNKLMKLVSMGFMKKQTVSGGALETGVVQNKRD